MMMNSTKRDYEELEDLFALGGQYLCHDYANDGMIPPIYGNGNVNPAVGYRQRQQPCLSVADKKRQDRNAREKQRSFRITKQIEELKELLVNSGVTVSTPVFCFPLACLLACLLDMPGKKPLTCFFPLSFPLYVFL